jgi:DNA sulfur modification protein DndB
MTNGSAYGSTGSAAVPRLGASAMRNRSDGRLDQTTARAIEIADYLAELEQSPYWNALESSFKLARATGKIPLVKAVAALKPLVGGDGAFKQIGMHDLQSQRDVVLNFFVALSSCFGKRWNDRDNVFQHSVGFIAAIDFLQRRVIPHCSVRKSFTAPSIRRTLSLADLILLSEVRRFGNYPRKIIYSRLIEAFKLTG